MSSIAFKSVDRTTLPPLIMPVLKTHCRVEFSRDDDYLKTVAARAIDLFERLTGLDIFARVYNWTVAIDDGEASGDAWRWPGPVVPFTGFTAVDGATDVAGQYAILTASAELIGPAWLERATGAPEFMPTMTAASGYETLDTLPPGVLDFILRAGAWLYEYREAGMMPGADMLAYGNSLLAGHWRPRI